MDGLYKPSFAGFVDVDLTDRKLSLRSLVSPLINIRINSTSSCFHLGSFNFVKMNIPNTQSNFMN